MVFFIRSINQALLSLRDKGIFEYACPEDVNNLNLEKHFA
jgi:hypothetical protein